MRWDEMSMSQKSEAIGLMVRNGVTDIGTMKQMWDDMDGRKKPQQPPFAKRFEENPPRTIPTSQGNATHFMAADEAKGRYFAYPTVQPIDYKDVRSPLKYYGDMALDRALENNDVMEFPTLEDAIKYSENYKRPPSTGAYLNNEFHPLYSPYDYVRSFAEGGHASPDHDPKHPYHYHVNGQKVVVTHEDWEKYKDDPTFREVRAAIEAEQAAHPEPEYDEIENPAWRTAYQRIALSNPNYWNGSKYVLSPLPQGYSRDERGVAMDAEGNYYAPVNDISYSNQSAPFFVNNERSMVNGNTVPVRYEQVQVPERIIRQLRQPLPVDKVMNIAGLREDSIDRYIKDNTKQTLQTLYKAPTYYPSENTFERLDNDEMDAYIEWLRNESKKFPQVITKDELKDWFITAEEMGEDLTDDINVYSPDEDFERGINKYISVPQNKVLQKKTYIPTRGEAEKKAVISIGDLEKVGTFAYGGSIDIPPDRFFGIATPNVTDNNIYYSKKSMLPEVKVVATGDPRKVNNDYYKAHAVERAAFEDRVANRVDQGWVPQTMLGLATVPLEVEGLVGLRLLYEQLPKWVLNVPKNPNRYYRIVDKRAIDDYIKSKKIRSAEAAKEAGVDTEGPKQAGRFLLKKNHSYNMFSKGEPWQGGLSIRDKSKPYILVSKENTGKTIWEQSNIDFSHKGHSGIYRPRYEGDLDATPSMYFDYYKPKLIGYTKHNFDEGGSPDETPDKKPAIPVKGYLPDYYPSQQEWLRNWFGNREEQINDNFKGIALGVNGFDTSRSMPVQYVERAIDGSMKVPVKYQSIFNDPDNPTSAYNRDTRQIFIDPNMQDIESTLLHERTHALNHQLPQRVVGQQGYEMSPIESKVRDVMMPWYKENEQDLDEYWDDPVEIYARMMQMRYRLNLDPTKKVTKDDLKKWRKDGLLRQYEMGVYDDDTLLQLFNEVADNRQVQNNQQNTYVIHTDIGLGYV